MNGELLLVGSVAVVGVLHTIVPDHWVPITLIARQRGWTKQETRNAAIKAGTGHVLSTLAIALVVWGAGAALATRFGHWVDLASSAALVAFGLWIAISAWLETRDGGHGHHHHHHYHEHTFIEGDLEHIHGHECHKVTTEDGLFEISIYEEGMPPHFRLTGVPVDRVLVETVRENGEKQTFRFQDRGRYLESTEAIPEPHEFKAMVIVSHARHTHHYEVFFKEEAHHHEGHDHADHGHDHGHSKGHTHAPKQSQRTALLLILGSSPMVEGIPAFFAAGKYGFGLIAVMSLVFALSTIVTYVVLCVYSTAGLQKVKFGALERYGEVVSGAFIALVGVVFWVWPVL